MKRLTAFLVIALVFGGEAQTVRDIYKRIEQKLDKDKYYLDIKSVPFSVSYTNRVTSNDEFPLFYESTPYKFDRNATYIVFFLEEGMELDSMALLYILKEPSMEQSEGTFLDVSGGPQNRDPTLEIRFKDMYEMYFNDKAAYDKLWLYVDDYITQNEEPASHLGESIKSKMEEEVETSTAMTATDNTDFIDFIKANSIHMFPEASSVAPGGADTASSESSAPSLGRGRGSRGGGGGGSDFVIDAGFSSFSVYHSFLNKSQKFSYLSLEATTEPNTLNVLPWESMTLDAGLRSLLTIGGGDLRNAFIVDAKIMARMSVNTSSIIEPVPFALMDPPKLNVGSGVAMELHGSRFVGFPFLNISFATGEPDFTDPIVTQTINERDVAFFTAQQWETSVSYYWASANDRLVRFRMDIGVGQTPVYKAFYTGGELDSAYLDYNDLQPLLALYFNFAPSNEDYMGASMRFFDGRPTFDVWLKLFTLMNDYDFRFAVKTIMSSFFRPLRPWENSSGVFFQLRFRWGFEK